MPSIAELRRVTQPESVMGRASAEHWAGRLYMRRVSPYVTRALLRAGMSANAVTWLMFPSGLLAGLALTAPGLLGPVLAVVLIQIQLLVDCCDGEVARWRGTSSPAGVFLDKGGHYTTEALIPIALGIRAAGFPFEAPEDFLWTTLGLLLALIIVLNKALNDMVHVARANAGLDKLADHRDEAVPTQTFVARLRRAARFVPFHRLYHSVELTLIAFAAAVLGLILTAAGVENGELVVDRWLVGLLVPLALLALVGHFVAILASKRVRG